MPWIKEEKLYPADQVAQLNLMHRALSSMDTALAMEKLLDLLQRYPTNKEALAAIGAALNEK